MKKEHNLENSTEQGLNKPVVRSSISELGRRGFTFDWGKMQPNKEYFISRDDIISMDMLWFLNKQKIQERAKELNAEVVMFEDVIKDCLVIMLRPYYT